MQKQDHPRRLSIVSTLYRSGSYLEEFVGRVVSAAETFGGSFEIILVNDGCPENSLDIALQLKQNEPRIKIMDLTRNFGHHRAYLAGLAEAKGDFVFAIDCDLEEEPSLLLPLYDRMVKDSADQVFGVERQRLSVRPQMVLGQIFWWFLRRISPTPIVPNQASARLMTRRFVQALLRYPEREVFLSGIMSLVGFKQSAMEIERKKRKTTSYTISRRLDLMLDAVTSFSSKPLMMVFYAGILVSALAFLGSIFVIARWVFWRNFLLGWPSLFLSLWFLAGLILASQGLIGIYLSKSYLESKQRPRFLVREIFD